jgi:N utilization substance protein B
LYEYEFRSKAGDTTADVDSIVVKNIEPYAKALGDTEFVRDLTQGVFKEMDKLDEELQPLAPEWPISTISAIDRNVLRIGLFELTRRQESVPPKVVINEAVELAKAFGSDNSSKFVNGVLGTAYRNITGGEEESDKHAGAKKPKTASQPESKPAESAESEVAEASGEQPAGDEPGDAK